MGHRQVLPATYQARTITSGPGGIGWYSHWFAPRRQRRRKRGGRRRSRCHQRPERVPLATAPASLANQPKPYLDVNGDGFVAPDDALAVINHINAFGPGPVEPDIIVEDAEGESMLSPFSSQARSSLAATTTQPRLDETIALLAFDMAEQESVRRKRPA